MKAVALASLTALAIAGAACSDTPTKTEAPASQPELTPVSAPADDGFNLPVPGETPVSAPADDGFNLPVPGQAPAPAVPTDGFNLPTDLPATNSLNSVPEIDTSKLEPAEDIPPEDEIIRLDP